MKVVADTNVIISAIFWKKRLEDFAQLINKRRITLCFSPQTISELYRVVSYPHIANKAKEGAFDSFAILDRIIASSFIVYPKRTFAVIADDPSDNKFFDCAVAAQASCIISGDRHLLALKNFQNISILSPQQFLKKFKTLRLRSG